MAWRVAVQQRAHAENARPGLFRPRLSTLKDPVEVIARIPNGGHSIGEKGGPLPSHEVHMRVDQTRHDDLAGSIDDFVSVFLIGSVLPASPD